MRSVTFIWMVLLAMILCGLRVVAIAQTPDAATEPSIFEKPLPQTQLEFLKLLEGKTVDAALKDKQLSKLINTIVPGCTFHYGHDMTLDDALDLALKGSAEPVRIRGGRYFFIHGAMGPAGGRGFFWVDMQSGIAVGGFAYHPTNGEPAPALILFSRQVRQQSIGMSQLPSALASDLMAWQRAYQVSPVIARYFIDGTNRRMLLEHDEDYCSPADGSAALSGCERENADAADLDVEVAYYVDQIHFLPAGTARKLNENQLTWMAEHSKQCLADAHPDACRARTSRRQVELILHISGRRGGRR